MVRAAERGRVYGRSSGVGANAAVFTRVDQRERDRDLLLSHAPTAGPPLPVEAVRAMLAVRLRQLADGRSGASLPAVRALAGLLDGRDLPTIGRYHAVGTGDLGALATAVLALPSEVLAPGDALPLISSSALTVGRALLAADAAGRWADGLIGTAGLTAAAFGAVPEAWLPAAAGPDPEVGTAASRLSAARAGAEEQVPERPIAVQDPYGLRTAPQTIGLLLAAVDRLGGQVERNLAGPENPAVLPDGAVVHHGAFHLVALTAAVDGLSGAVARAAGGSLQRLGLLLRGGAEQRPAFLAAASGRSGLMALEYVAASALAEINAAAVPAGLQTAVLGAGVESDAGFAPQAVTQLERALAAARVVGAAELLAAVRARLRSGGRVPARFSPLHPVAADLPADLTGLLAAAEQVLGQEPSGE
jgi:histidine ammonia-lyase